jgi:hypothetical protein
MPNEILPPAPKRSLWRRFVDRITPNVFKMDEAEAMKMLESLTADVPPELLEEIQATLAGRELSAQEAMMLGIKKAFDMPMPIDANGQTRQTRQVLSRSLPQRTFEAKRIWTEGMEVEEFETVFVPSAPGRDQRKCGLWTKYKGALVRPETIPEDAWPVERGAT